MPCVCIVFVETLNSNNPAWVSRREATPVFLSSLRSSQIARKHVESVIFCIPGNISEIPEFSQPEFETLSCGGFRCQKIIECKGRGEPWGFREAVRTATSDGNESRILFTLTYPGTVNWSALDRAMDDFESNPLVKTVAFRTPHGSPSARGMEFVFTVASVAKLITESAMFSSLVDVGSGDHWADAVVALSERLLLTQSEVLHHVWDDREGIVMCDVGDNVVFAEQPYGEHETLLVVHKG